MVAVEVTGTRMDVSLKCVSHGGAWRVRSGTQAIARPVENALSNHFAQGYTMIYRYDIFYCIS